MLLVKGLSCWRIVIQYMVEFLIFVVKVIKLTYRLYAFPQDYYQRMIFTLYCTKTFVFMGWASDILLLEDIPKTAYVCACDRDIKPKLWLYLTTICLNIYRRKNLVESFSGKNSVNNYFYNGGLFKF